MSRAFRGIHGTRRDEVCVVAPSAAPRKTVTDETKKRSTREHLQPTKIHTKSCASQSTKNKLGRQRYSTWRHLIGCSAFGCPPRWKVPPRSEVRFSPFLFISPRREFGQPILGRPNEAPHVARARPISNRRCRSLTSAPMMTSSPPSSATSKLRSPASKPRARRAWTSSRASATR